MEILLGYQSYEARSKSSTGMRLVNMYAEPNPSGSKYPFTLYSTSGSVEFADLGTNKEVQGMQKMGNLLYAVSGNEVFKIDTAGTVTSLGSITGTEQRVDLSNNGTQLSILNADGDMWIATSSTLTQVTDVDFPTASSVTFLDGYTIVSTEDTGQFQISSLYESAVYDALDFATAEEQPDDLVRVFAFNGALWLFGESSYEVYYNSGNVDFPFAQIQGAVNTTRGLAAKFSVVDADNRLFFLGDDKVFYTIADRYGCQRVSTHAVEAALEGYGDVSDAYCLVHEKNGHKFLTITFPSANKTWEYNIATDLWHERTTLVGNQPKRWRANCQETFANKELVGDNSNGKIYELSDTTYTEAGGIIERVAQGSVQWQQDRWIAYDYVRLDISAGIGLTTGQGSDPQVMMKYSDDDLQTWSNEKWRSMGKIGEYFKRVIWRRLGTSKQRIFQFRVTDPVPVTITGCYATGRVGRE